MMTQNPGKTLYPRIEEALSHTLKSLESEQLTGTSRELLLRNKRRLEAALARINKGSFGACCDCGDVLTFEELEDDPATPFCAYCKEEREATPID
jgi:DnaK suppressor protein